MGLFLEDEYQIYFLEEEDQIYCSKVLWLEIVETLERPDYDGIKQSRSPLL